MTGQKHRRIPIFIPHLGCPHGCVFCDQNSISGCKSFDESSVAPQIEKALLTIPQDCDCQIAYFGGSFTGIDRGLMIRLLDLASEYVKRGKVSSVRLSTRPDMINGEILRILSSYPVRTVELGIQSTSDRVLRASGRGHTAKDSEIACRAVVESGFELVGQMMIGLPESTPADEIGTARDIVSFGAVASRIYPTVVFAGTPLERMTKEGLYHPLTLDGAIGRSANVYEIFEENGIRCLRIGLCASEELTDCSCAVAGPNHPALGELVLGEVAYRKLAREIVKNHLENQAVKIETPPSELSRTVGQKRRNIIRLKEEYGTTVVSVTGNSGVQSLAVIRTENAEGV